MKVAITILSTLTNPSTRNIEGIKDTYISLADEYTKTNLLNNQYSFYFYYCKEDIDNEIVFEKIETFKNVKVFNVYIKMKEHIYNTFEKGITILKELDGFDWYIRANISSYINIPLLDKFLKDFDEDKVYAAALNTLVYDEKYINDLYPRGDFSIFSNKTREGILSVYLKFYRNDIDTKNRFIIPHVDDCLFGLCYIEYFGKRYYEHLQVLTYNFLPTNTVSDVNHFSFCALSSRVKTLPPEVRYSGYSWDDNDYRKYDVSKMKTCDELIRNTDYSSDKFKLDDLFVNSRKNVIVKYTLAALDDIKTAIRYKREKEGK
jgi:hypothetical protein